MELPEWYAASEAEEYNADFDSDADVEWYVRVLQQDDSDDSDNDYLMTKWRPQCCF